jgi:hypothetical protein
MKMSDLKKHLPAKRLVFSAICDVAALMFFVVGYLVVDHFNDWMDTQAPSGVSAQTSERSEAASHILTHDEPATTDINRNLAK